MQNSKPSCQGVAKVFRVVFSTLCLAVLGC